MTEFDPASGDPDYNAALDRFLDGLLDDPATPAEAAVLADTDAIAKALGLIGGALAAEGSGTTAAAGAVPPVAAGGGTVVQLSAWRSKLNPRVFASAAALVVALGVGIPVVLSSSGGSSDNDASTAMSERAPESIAGDTSAGQAATAPGAAPAAPMADAYGATGALPNSADTGAVSGLDASGNASKAAPGAATTGTGAAAAGGSVADPKSAADAPALASEEAARQASTPEFERAVACARGIFTGTTTSVQPDPDGKHYSVTILVDKWIAPSKSGPLTVTFRVLGPNLNSPGQDESLRAGMRRLWVFGPSEEERAYAFQESDWPATKKKINAIRDEQAGQGC